MPCGDLLGEARPGQEREPRLRRRWPSSSTSTSLMSMSESFSIPLVALHDGRPARDEGRRASRTTLAERVRRDRRRPRARRRGGPPPRSPVAVSVGGQLGDREVAALTRSSLICAARSGLCDQRRRVVALVREHLREGRPPGACAEHGDWRHGLIATRSGRGVRAGRDLPLDRSACAAYVSPAADAPVASRRRDLRSPPPCSGRPAAQRRAERLPRRDQRPQEPLAAQGDPLATGMSRFLHRDAADAARPSASTTDDPVIGRFYPTSCFAQERRPDLYVQFSGLRLRVDEPDEEDDLRRRREPSTTTHDFLMDGSDDVRLLPAEALGELGAVHRRACIEQPGGAVAGVSPGRGRTYGTRSARRS